jgi:hypothetical protein
VVVVVDGQSWPASISDATWSVVVPRSLSDGTYDVQVIATDQAGNRGESLTLAALVADLTAPVADPVYLPADSWDPRIHEVSIQFSEAVSGVDIGSCELSRNGQPIDLGDTTLVAVSDTRYVLDVSRVTALSGQYMFTLKAAAASIRDAAGNALAADASVTFPVRAGQNVRNVDDVNNDGQVTPLDVLLVINDINNQSLNPHNDASAPLFADVNGDDMVSATDVLLIIDHLNRDDLQGLSPQPAEGESDAAAAPAVVGHHPRMIPINCTTNPVVSRPSPRNEDQFEDQLLTSDVVG